MKTFSVRILMLCFAIFIMACENDIATVDKLSAQKNLNIEKGKNVEVLYSDQGIVKARITAPVVNHYKSTKDPYTEMPEGFTVLFYDDSMKVENYLKADYGIVHDKTNEMLARDNVEVTGVNGDKLNTSELIWNDKTKKLSSEKHVSIQTKDEILFGDGFTSNQDLSDYKIKHFRGKLKLKEQIPGD